MRIGIIADTHDRIDAIESAVDVFERNDVFVVIHCGDIARPAMIPPFEPFEFHAVLGNNDEPYREELTAAIAELGSNSEFHGLFADLEFDGVRFAVTHGVVEDTIYEHAESGEYDYVLHGHFHEAKRSVVDGTVVINPGAHRSVVVLDTKTGNARFVPLEGVDTSR